MKKIFAIILTIFSAHAMEPEVKPCFFKNMPIEVRDLIASYVTYDIETEKEFIERKKFSSYPTERPMAEKDKNKRAIASSWLEEHKYIQVASNGRVSHMYLC